MVFTFVVLIILVAPISLFIHELGHILPALMFKSERSSIIIGRGPLLMKLQFGKVRLEMNWLFFQGAHSASERTDEFTNREKAWISFGGPLLNALVAMTCFWVLLPSESRVILIFAFFNGYLAIVNSIPFSFKGKKSDGYQFLQGLLTRTILRG